MNEPAAIPAKYVERRSANAGARSDEARTNTRNQIISKPSEMNPMTAAKDIARRSESAGVCDATETETAGAEEKLEPLLSPTKMAVAATSKLRHTAIRREPDWPKSRKRKVAHR